MVPLEIIVNGEVVETLDAGAEGRPGFFNLPVPIARSSWVAVRIRASSHTNPIFVLVDEKPIRVRQSLEWCLKCVDQCWSQKERFIAPAEHEEAVAAYEHARQIYRQRLGESRP